MKHQKSFMHRPFNIDNDMVAVLDFHREHVKINFPDSKYKRKAFRMQLEEGYAKYPEGMMVWTVKGGVVAFLWLEVRTDEYKDIEYGYVRYVHVLEHMRRQGLGDELMKMVDEFYKKRKVLELRVGTRVDNNAARSLYRKYGYEPERVLMVKRGRK